MIQIFQSLLWRSTRFLWQWNREGKWVCWEPSIRCVTMMTLFHGLLFLFHVFSYCHRPLTALTIGCFLFVSAHQHRSISSNHVTRQIEYQLPSKWTPLERQALSLTIIIAIMPLLNSRPKDSQCQAVHSGRRGESIRTQKHVNCAKRAKSCSS